jgi:hypothetical protein
MGSFKENRTLSVIWDKLQSLLGYSGVSNPLLANTTIDEPLTLYVETTGNDLNPGTQDKPFRTIQGAIDSLLNVTITSAVTIKVGTGDFDGFEIPALRIIKTGQLNIEGTRTVVTTGSITSGSGAGVVVDNVTDLSGVATGDFIDINNNSYGAIYQKVSSNRLETTSGYNGGIGIAYTVYRNATNILPNTASLNAFVSVLNLRSDALLANFMPVVIKYVNAEATTDESTASLEGMGLGFYGCKFTLSGADSTGLVIAGNTTIQACYFRNTSDSCSSVSLSSLGRVINARIISCAFDGTGSTTAHVTRGAGTGSLVNIFVSAVVINFEIPFRVDVSSVGAINGNYSVNIQGATTAYYFVGRRANMSISSTSFAFSNPITNTAWISVAKGASVQIAASATAQGTTEISVDGTTTTLAAMRALSPKAFPATPNVYGTVVYE